MKCQFCLGIQVGRKYECPVCGRKLLHSLPTREDIYQQAEVLRLKWPLIRLQHCELYEEASIPGVRKVSDGMRRREKEDGKND